MFSEENITSASIPDCDEWGIDSWWDCYDWLKYYDELRKDFPREFANTKFVTEWHNCESWLSGNLDCRTFNTVFRDKMSSEGLLEALYGDAAVILAPIGAATDVITGVSGAASGAGKGIKTGGKFLQYAIPIAGGATLIGVGIWAWRKYIR